MTFASGRYNSLEDRRWLPFRNDAASEVPPFGVMRITGRSTEGTGDAKIIFLTADQPDADTEEDPLSGLVAVNGPFSVAAGGYGQCTQDWPAQIRQDGTTSTTGGEIGPVDGSWMLESTGKGFTRLSGGVTLASGVIAVWATPKAASATRKLLVRFTLDAALATSDASKAATITNQYGPGTDADDTAITVHNLLTQTAATYVFSGASGAAGLAMWDSAQNYRIIQMECP